MSGAVLHLICSFTGSQVAGALQQVLERQGLSVRVQEHPYGQVAETLSSLGDLPASDAPGWSAAEWVVALVRPADAVRVLGADADPCYNGDLGVADQWLTAIVDGIRDQTAVGRRVLVCVTPVDDALAKNPAASWAQEAAVELCAQAASAGAVVVPPPPGTTWHRSLDVMAHLPYQAKWMKAVGAALARAFFMATVPATKVLVLDCDDTLWGGACAEVGPGGVDVGAPWDTVQRFAVDRADNGVVVCLASHNAEADVLAVLNSRRLALLPEQVAARRVGWHPKSQMLTELSQELGLALESFVFVDDNPVQRSHVRAELSQVIVPEFTTIDDAGRLLGELWGFATGALTDEDRNRTRSYQIERERNTVKAAARDHAEFVANLQVAVTISPVTAVDLPRARQLGQRVTQFACVEPGFSIDAHLDGSPVQGTEMWRVDVADRLGVYGFVGLVMHHVDGVDLVVDALLLSCRVLGRGVEERLLASLRNAAAEAGCRGIRFRTPVTDRNVPIRRFLRTIGQAVITDAAGIITANVSVGVDGRLQATLVDQENVQPRPEFFKAVDVSGS